MPTNQEVFQGGHVLDFWACDINPLTGAIESNGGVECRISYENVVYHVIVADALDKHSTVYQPNQSAEKK